MPVAVPSSSASPSRIRRGSIRVQLPAPAKSIRAAIYTRKSTNEGLDSDWTTLDVQRQAAEAYILSQGWEAIPDRYDDGGFSGGTLERPALKRLLADIDAGRVDCVVVHKIDRLSRSLLDFVRIAEVFEARQVGLVSVTQQISTTSSAGRLMLNVLFSFAQFEREIIGERTAAAMCAARKKGRWIGGGVILGYRPDKENHSLVVDEEEAACVRELFALYLQRRSLLAVVQEVNSRGWAKKRWIKGQGAGYGRPYDKVYLQRLLINPTYIGKVTLHGEIFEGLHEAIIDEETFNQAQELLASNRNGQTPGPETRNKHQALLRGLIKCGVCGSALGHTYTKKGNRLYRYYTCTTKVKKGKDACPTPSFAAADIEEFVVEQIRRVACDPELADQVFTEAVQQREDALARLRSEHDRLIKQKIQRDEEVRRLTTTLAHNGESESILSRIAEAESQSATITSRLAELEREIGGHQGMTINLEHLRATLAEFDGIWDVLLPHEKGQLIHSLVQRVVCSPGGEIQVIFRTDTATN